MLINLTDEACRKILNANIRLKFVIFFFTFQKNVFNEQFTAFLGRPGSSF